MEEKSKGKQYLAELSIIELLRRQVKIAAEEGCNGHSLTSWEKQGNRTRARIRSRIEHVFGSMTQRTGNLILRTVGISRAEVKLGLRNIAYNMERFCFLMRQTA